MATSQMRRNPFGAIDPVSSRMWDWFTTPSGATPMSRLFGETNAYVPPIDIYETREEVILAASLPGLDAEKVNIEVLESELTLSGEQRSVLCFEPEENATQHLQGIPRFGKFSFVFQLPCAVEADQAQAKYENGLLCLRFLKAQKNRPIRVAIQNGSQSQPMAAMTEAPEMQEALPEGVQPAKTRSKTAR